MPGPELSAAEFAVFVADDDAEWRLILERTLAAAGVKVRSFASAGELLAECGDQTAGCVLADIRMPAMDGLQLHEELRRQRPELPVILMSGYADLPTALRALRTGAFDFIEKPFHELDLVERVRRALSQRAAGAQRLSAIAAIHRKLTTLSPREREVLQLVAAGLPNKRIARRFRLSIKTVEIHRGRVMEKMQAASLADLVRMVALVQGEALAPNPEHLPHLEPLYRQWFDAAPPTVLLDARGHVLAANPSLLRLLGREALEVVGSDWFRGFAAGGDPETAAQLYRARLSTGNLPATEEFTIAAIDGARQLTWRYSVLRDTVAGILGASAMATEKLESGVAPGQASALESAERYQKLFQYSNDAILIVDEQGQVADANRRALRLFEYAKSELVGLAASHLEVTGAAEETNRRTLTGGGAFLYETAFRTKSGRTFPAEVSVSILRAGGGAWIQSAIRDLSERRRAELLEIERRALERSNRELEEFAAVASHDLQEPLRKIEAFAARLLAGESPCLDQQGTDYVQRIGHAARRMQALIVDLLNLARVSARAEPLQPVALDQVAREVLGDLEAQVGRTGATIDLQPLPVVVADRLQMRQLLQNLLGNALKFQPAGSAPRVTVRAEVSSEAAGQGPEAMCNLFVADNGIGFDPQKLSTMLKPFGRLHGSGEYDGSGIGLAICQKIARRHGGRITAHSAPGAGATFVVTLPMRPPEPGPHHGPGVVSSSATEAARTGREKK